MQGFPVMPIKLELIKEETNITEIGRFMAYHSGRIYIVFVDNVILEMYWTEGCCYNNKLLLHDHPPLGYCQLLLSNGQYQLLPVVHTPQPYQRSVLTISIVILFVVKTHKPLNFSVLLKDTPQYIQPPYEDKFWE